MKFGQGPTGDAQLNEDLNRIARGGTKKDEHVPSWPCKHCRAMGNSAQSTVCGMCGKPR